MQNSVGEVKLREEETTSFNAPSSSSSSSSTFSDMDWGAVVGMELAKQSLLESVIWSRTRSDDYKRLGIRPSRGILLYGPPGTGKTLIARTVAERANVTFLSMSFAEIMRSGVGESEAAIAVAFEQARRSSPSVLFIDEIQALFGERKDAGAVSKKMTSQLLQEIDGMSSRQTIMDEVRDGFEVNHEHQSKEEESSRSSSDTAITFSVEEHHVVVLAATNLPQCLDPSLLRPGRFDKLIHIGLPSPTNREQIFRNLLMRSGESLGVTKQEVESMCFFVGAMGTDMTGAEIENVFRIAVGQRVEERPMGNQDIMKAMDIVRATKMQLATL